MLQLVSNHLLLPVLIQTKWTQAVSTTIAITIRIELPNLAKIVSRVILSMTMFSSHSRSNQSKLLEMNDALGKSRMKLTSQMMSTAWDSDPWLAPSSTEQSQRIDASDPITEALSEATQTKTKLKQTLIASATTITWRRSNQWPRETHQAC